jgi:hypothetical protein
VKAVLFIDLVQYTFVLFPTASIQYNIKISQQRLTRVKIACNEVCAMNHAV